MKPDIDRINLIIGDIEKTISKDRGKVITGGIAVATYAMEDLLLYIRNLQTENTMLRHELDSLHPPHP
jgi:hypothetical protein